jgi:RNA polymerase sigma factor (sigma-70 family)
MSEGDWLAARFEQNRPHLRAVAYRMLGSAAEADDAVQEAWLRLSRSGGDSVQNLAGWLTTTVARVCLDMLRARKARREEPLPAHPPGPASGSAGGAGPEQEVLLADSVGLALLVVLDALTPAERAAFVLHDMFGLPFEDIAAIVGRTPNSESPPSPSRPIRKNRRWNATSSIPSFTASSAVATTTCAGWSSCWPTARSPGQCSAPPGSPTGLQPAVTAQPAAAGCRTPGAFPGPTCQRHARGGQRHHPVPPRCRHREMRTEAPWGQPTRRRLPAARSSCQRCGVGRPPARR